MRAILRRPPGWRWRYPFLPGDAGAQDRGTHRGRGGRVRTALDGRPSRRCRAGRRPWWRLGGAFVRRSLENHGVYGGTGESGGSGRYVTNGVTATGVGVQWFALRSAAPSETAWRLVWTSAPGPRGSAGSRGSGGCGTGRRDQRSAPRVQLRRDDGVLREIRRQRGGGHSPKPKSAKTEGPARALQRRARVLGNGSSAGRWRRTCGPPMPDPTARVR